MLEARIKPEFDDWRKKARALLDRGLAPGEIAWVSARDPNETLEGLFAEVELEGPVTRRASVPRDFVERARFVAAHRDEGRWALLYRVLWRLTHGEAELLRIAVDPDIQRMDSMYRSVRRDLHKMKAFVRFKELRDAETGEAHFVAWYRPDHLIVRLGAPFFAERFNGMSWSILTEDECAHWDRERLSYSSGCPKSMAPQGDEAEELWKTYYASTFNPARIKLRAMKKELPVRYWENLPETELIPRLIREAPARLQEFYESQPKRAEDFLPSSAGELGLDDLREAARACRACSICEHATQTVFGEGPRDARILIIGEQPGDQEDLSGRPFQGPAGQLLDRAFALAGIDRSRVYLTNAVKHFKWTPQGKTRLHQRPSASEISACKPWLRAEVELLKPELIICLGATAAQSVFGKSVTLGELRGRVHSTAWSANTWVTTHPSAVLRTEEAARGEAFDRLVEDLRRAVGFSFPT